MVCTVIISKEDSLYIAKDIRTNIADQGNTPEEALNNLQEALELYYEDDKNLCENSSEMLFMTSLEVAI